MSILAWKTPYEILSKTPPSYDHLGIFRRLCYAAILPPLDKFSPMGRRCLFIDYPTHQKGYILYD